jgi:hypothetical protein
MVQSKLSDEETEIIMGFCAGGRPVQLVKYINRLLYEKGLGSDVCARPFEIRNKQELEHPCFAVGYLSKVESYLIESHGRKPQKAVSDTLKFIGKLKTEITKYFSKEQLCQEQ